MTDFEAGLAALRKIPAVAAVLKNASGPVYLVGGCLRDLLLGREVNDFDLAVWGDLEETAARTASSLGVRAVPLGRAPAIVFRLIHQGLIVDVSPLEEPDILADLLRRDLTINALALELTSETDRAWIIDPVQGLKDLEEKRARFVSEQNLIKDPLRLLRLFRFAATLELSLAPDSLALVGKHALLINQTPGERIREELLKLLSVPGSHPLVTAMLEHGLLEALIPELTPLRGCGQNHYHHLDVLDHTLLALKRLEEIMAAPEEYLPRYAPELRRYLSQGHCPAWLKMALLWHDLGKPETRKVEDGGRTTFHRHEQLSEKLAGRLAARFRMSAAETALIRRLVRHHMRPFLLREARAGGHLTRRGVYRFGRDVGDDLWGLVVLSLADAAAAQGPAQEAQGGLEGLAVFFDHLLEELLAQKAKLIKMPRLLSGRDILNELGLEPSPEVGRILAAIEEAQALGRVATRKEALILARRVLRERASGKTTAGLWPPWIGSGKASRPCLWSTRPNQTGPSPRSSGPCSAWPTVFRTGWSWVWIHPY
ncbi:MAG: HD domain-containing protein [Pseudomonadota bacterium]